MMRHPSKDAARREPGMSVGQVNHRDHITSAAELLAAVVPGGARSLPDFVVLAALLDHPHLAAPYVSRLHPGDWTTDLHRIMARIALWHLRTIGRVDRRQLADVLNDAGTIQPASLALELATLGRVAELICGGDFVADAVAALSTHRRGVTV